MLLSGHMAEGMNVPDERLLSDSPSWEDVGFNSQLGIGVPHARLLLSGCARNVHVHRARRISALTADPDWQRRGIDPSAMSTLDLTRGHAASPFPLDRLYTVASASLRTLELQMGRVEEARMVHMLLWGAAASQLDLAVVSTLEEAALRALEEHRGMSEPEMVD